ncbi:MAG: hypothetical protein KDD53_07455, partial [Bdellovibrionales bacterium]|nr:hypothetical protein [Bdellovibrionales bacterium]
GGTDDCASQQEEVVGLLAQIVAGSFKQLAQSEVAALWPDSSVTRLMNYDAAALRGVKGAVLEVIEFANAQLVMLRELKRDVEVQLLEIHLALSRGRIRKSNFQNVLGLLARSALVYDRDAVLQYTRSPELTGVHRHLLDVFDLPELDSSVSRMTEQLQTISHTWTSTRQFLSGHLVEVGIFLIVALDLIPLIHDYGPWIADFWKRIFG